MENQFRIKGFVVWFLCALFFMYEFLLRTVVGTFQHEIMSDLQINSMQFSLLSTTVFLLIYGVMQIPVGIIAENFGLKKSLFLASIACGTSALIFSYADGFQLAFYARLLMGFGASFGFVCLLIAVNDWMPSRYIAIFIGLSQFIGTLGPMAAAGPIESLSSSSTVTWQNVFFVLGVIGLALSFLVLFFVENKQQCSGKYIVLSKPEKILTSAKRIFSRSQPWILGLVSTFVYFSIEYLSENEGRLFLTLKGQSSQSASNMLTLSWIGFAVACPLVGFLSDFFERRKSILSFCCLLNLVAIFMIVLLEKSLYLQIGFFVLGLGASGIGIGFAMVAEQFKKPFVAVGFGLVNALVMSISAINAPLLGMVLDQVSNQNTPILQDYIQTFYILIGIALAGFLISIFWIKETYCKSAVSFTFLKIK